MPYIQDQLHHLSEMSIPSAVLGSAEKEGEQQQEQTYSMLYAQPLPLLKLLYLTPEKVARSGKLMVGRCTLKPGQVVWEVHRSRSRNSNPRR